MSATISPLAPKKYPAMPAIDGVRIATAEAGIKYRNRTDLLAMAFDPGTQVAGVFTRSKCPSAPVDFCRKNLAGGSPRAGRQFRQRQRLHRHERPRVPPTGEAAALRRLPAGEVFLASTGVIGEPLDAGRRASAWPAWPRKLGPAAFGCRSAIMTTDTYPKLATVTVQLGDVDVIMNGIAKGAGMIAPDMATMLSFIATDAPIAAPVLQALLSAGVGKTFNAVTVDSDTSTSDTLLLSPPARPRSAARRASSGQDPRLAAFKRALNKPLNRWRCRWCATARARARRSR